MEPKHDSLLWVLERNAAVHQLVDMCEGKTARSTRVSLSDMTVVELAQAFLHHEPIGVVITDGKVEPPGPIIVYANPAFARLTGRNLTDIVGQSPRFMQGRETRRAVLDGFRQALQARQRFHGYLTNYRGDGTRYRVEIDCRPVLSASGSVENFISFEREVVRRVGRPSLDAAGRYQPLAGGSESLSTALRSLQVFVHSEAEA